MLGESDEPLDVSALPWPSPAGLAGGVPGRVRRRRRRRRPRRATAAAGRRPALPGPLLEEEELVRRSLAERAAAPPPVVDLTRLRAGLAAHFPRAGGGPAAARRGGRRAAARHACWPAGPAPGKTTTVAAAAGAAGRAARPAAADRAGRPHRARPPPGCRRRSRPQLPARLAGTAWPTPPPCTGCWAGAAARSATAAPSGCRYDVVVVDETSMVSLPMMARLLDAVRPQARLVLVGDPDQLASVEAGAVLGDLARADGRPEPALDAALRGCGLPTGVVNGVVTLDHVWRFDGTIAAFARAVQAGRRRRRARPAAPGRRRPHAGPSPMRSPGCGPTSSRPGPRSPRPPRRATPRRRWPRWSSTGCCARTGAARSAWPA